jgi:hypothetical protein
MYENRTTNLVEIVLTRVERRRNMEVVNIIKMY